MKALLVSLEFAPPLFSGNGVYARSIARALVASHPDLRLEVLTAVRDDAGTPPAVIDGHPAHCVPVPAATWGRLDSGSGWATFAAGAFTAFQSTTSLRSFDAILAVDWSGMAAVTALDHALAAAGEPPLSAPVIYLNFRVFSTSAGDGAGALYRRAEAAAVVRATASVVLCRRDALAAAALGWGLDPVGGTPFDATTGQHSEGDTAAAAAAAAGAIEGKGAGAAPLHHPHILILPPPLRADLAALAASAAAEGAEGGRGDEGGNRTLLLSAVRLSPEKGPLRFAQAVAVLSQRGMLRQRGLQPVIAGAVADAAYAAATRAALADCDPPLLDLSGRFMGPSEMADLYARAALNVHPATADAYGMSIVEAAAFGAPTAVQATLAPSASSSVRPVVDASPFFSRSATPPYTLNTQALLQALVASASSCESTPKTSKEDEESGDSSSVGAASSSASPFVSAAAVGRALVAAAAALPPVGACDLLGSPSPTGPCLFPVDWNEGTSPEALADALTAALDAVADGSDGSRAAATATALGWTELGGTGPALVTLLLECLKKA